MAIVPCPEIEPGYEEIELITGGSAVFDYQDAIYDVRPGTMLWHQTGERTVHKSNPEDPYRCLVLCFTVAEGHDRLGPRISTWENISAALMFAEHMEHAFHRQGIDRELLRDYALTSCRWQASVSNHGAYDPTSRRLCQRHYI